MKNRLSFNTNIFIEAMRQLRVTGIISVIIMAGLAIIRTSAIVSSYKDTDVMQLTFTGFDWMPWLIISFVLITPILMFQAFHFMNKRNASDLYHSLPHTRGTIYISMSAAVMTWVLISILSTVIPSLLSALFFSKYIAFVYDTFLLFILYNIVSCFIVGGAILIAKSFSGTLLNGIILSGLIIFIPRFIMTMIVSTLEGNIIFEGHIGNSFTNNELNTVISLVFSVMGIDTSIAVESVFISIPSIIYSFVLGIIYFVLGGFAFCRRNSETASQSAPNKKFQAAYRIIIAFVISSFIVNLLFNDIYIFSDKVDAFSYVIAYIGVAFVYFLYELISTKKLKNLIKAIPGLGIVAVLNIAMFFSLTGAYKSAMNFRPAPDEINSVTLISEIKPIYGSISYYDYVLNKIDGLDITDKEIIEEVSSALNKNVSIAENGASKLYSYSSNLYSTGFEINTNGKSKSRNIFLNEEQYDNLNKVVCSSKTFKDAWMSPPALKDINNVYAYDNQTGRILSDDKNTDELYTSFVNEMKNADFEKCFSAYVDNDSSMSFEFNYIINGTSYHMEIPIVKEIAPETAKKCYEIAKKNHLESLNSFNEYLDKLEKSGAEFEGDMYIYVLDENSKSLSFSNSLDLVHEVLSLRSDDYLDYDNPHQRCMEVNIQFYNVSDPELECFGYNFTFPIDEEALSKILSLTSDNDEFVYE